MRGKPAVTCTAKAKTTGQRCGRAPIPGGTVCVFHGGGTQKARAAGQRRVVEATLQRELAAYEKQQAARDAALAPWADDPTIRRVNALGSAAPADLRRVAREMAEGARVLRAAARALEQEQQEREEEDEMWGPADEEW